MTRQTIVAHTRLDVSTYNLLSQISKATHLTRSHMLGAAVTQWLRNAPADLPPELKIAISHELMKQHIETIKQLRWIYYAAEDAKDKLKYIDKRNDEKRSFPKHTRKLLKQLEKQIINQQKMLDEWIKDYQNSIRANVADVQVYTATQESE